MYIYTFFNFYVLRAHTFIHYHLPQSNLTALHLVFLTCSWWVIWSKHISSSDTLKRPDCHHHIFLFKSPLKASSYCPLTWIPHLGDHHHYPPVLILLPKSPFCHPVSLCLLALSDHPQQHIIQYLFTCLSRPTYCILFSVQYFSTLFSPSSPTPLFPRSSLLSETPLHQWQIVVLSSSPLLSNPLVTLLVSNSI